MSMNKSPNVHQNLNHPNYLFLSVKKKKKKITDCDYIKLNISQK